MMAEAGLAALWLAAALATLQLALAALGIVRTRRAAGAGEGGQEIARAAKGGHEAGFVAGEGQLTAALLAAVRPVAVVQGAMALVAMAALIAVFLQSDMSVRLVAENSHSLKPWLYRFAGSWGNHEGSMLLWVTILGVAGAAVSVLERRLSPRMMAATLGGQAAIALGFYAFLLWASNPFGRVNPAPSDGLGLNPLLQDPGLA